MTMDEIRTISEKCLAEYEAKLKPKVLGTRNLERWRVGNGIVKTREVSLDSLTEEQARHIIYEILNELAALPYDFS